MCTSPLNNVSNSALEGKPEGRAVERCYSTDVEVEEVEGFMLLFSF